MSETEAESDRAGAWFCPLLRLWSGQWRSGLWRVETGGDHRWPLPQCAWGFSGFEMGSAAAAARFENCFGGLWPVVPYFPSPRFCGVAEWAPEVAIV
jgi:hypothetical protein